MQSQGIRYAPFCWASFTVALVLEVGISRDPPIEVATELVDMLLAVEPRRGRERTLVKVESYRGKGKEGRC